MVLTSHNSGHRMINKLHRVLENVQMFYEICAIV